MQKEEKKVYVILEQAPLETAFLKKQTVLLNCDDHKGFIVDKLKKDYAKYRPDITHQCLLTLLDSPLNKAGLLQVYIRTEKNALIEINPSCKIPRTFKRFQSLMAQLLTKYKIRASQTNEILMKVIKNDLEAVLPVGILKVGTSTQARLVDINAFSKELSIDKPVLFSVGAVSHGNPGMENDYVTDSICISKFSLSASVALSKICNAYESLWNIEQF